MKRALALLLAGLALAPASASAAERSLLVNGDSLDGFREAIADVMKVAGERRCVVWASTRDNLRVLNWVRMVRAHPDWLADDGVHVSAEGYRARAKAAARAVRRCE